MGLLGKLFGAKPDIEKLRRALVQRDYVSALHLAEDIAAGGGQGAELEGLLTEAADGLAGRNLEEAGRLLAAGERESAVEHLRLALQQARSVEMKQRVEAGLVASAAEPQSGQGATAEAKAASVSSCSGCAPVARKEDELGALPDEQARFELILAGYPEPMRSAYLQRSPAFRQAFLLLHDGDDELALAAWQALKEDEQDAHYLFELGSLHGRLGQAAQAEKCLERALALEPGNLLIIDALLAVATDPIAAQEILQGQIEAGADPAFCQAKLCEVRVRQQDYSEALELARKALAAGYAAPEFLVLAASLFEQAGDVGSAESLLQGLPGAGCGGGVNLPLAEFWLRQERELGRVLDAFNGACRQEPENPRWQLRVAQTYLARKWNKQGLELLRKVVVDPRLDEHLRLEAEQLLAEG